MTKQRHVPRSSVSIATLLQAFPDEQACRAYVFYTRHNFRPHCPKCGKLAVFRQVAYRQSFMSACCAAWASATARTILDHTRIPLRMWFYAMLLYSDLVTGVSQRSLARLLGIHEKHSWALADKIRTHIAITEPDVVLGGDDMPVYIDEAQVHIGPERQRCVLFGLTDGRRCVIRIVRDRSAEALVPIIRESVCPGATIVSDGWSAYAHLEELGFRHSQVIHNRKIWVNHEGHSMTYVEGLWANLKRLLLGKSAHVTQDNLWKFVAEVVYRYNAGLDPAAAYWKLIGSFRTITPEDIENVRIRIDRR